MNAPVTLKGGAWQTATLTPAEAATVVGNGPARADHLIETSRSLRRAGWWVGGTGAGIGLLGMAAACAVVFGWSPPPPEFVLVDRQTREVFQPVKAADAPSLFSEDTARSYLRQFVEYCEEYRFETAKMKSERCSLFLSPEQQARYAKWFAESADGPIKRFGYGGSATADRLGFSKDGVGRGKTEVWWVRFNKVETVDRTTTCHPWIMQVQFRWRPELRMSQEDRSINLAGFQAIHFNSQPDPGRKEC